MRVISRFLLLISLLGIGSLGRSAARPGDEKGDKMLSTNECMAKGGIGIVNAHVYIDLTSAKNELILQDDKRWVGQGPETPELVVFFDNKVWSMVALPSEFDLSKAVIISFEGNVVRFLDLSKTSGGYYKRQKIQK